MKIIYLTIAGLMLISFMANAQEETLKATAEARTLEVNFRPFDSQVISINQLRFRRFYSDNTALRIGAHLGF